MSGKVTIKDIAELVKTTPKTVSKALNNQPGVRKELREKIKRAARELDYIPNIYGKGLSGKSSRTIGVIITDMSNPMYGLVLSELEREATKANYTIILCYSHEDPKREEQLIYMLLEKQVDGVIIRPVDQPGTQKNIDLLRRFNIPYIIINRVIPFHEQFCIRPNDFAAGYVAGQYLLRKGHVSIIHLTRRYSISPAEERLEGLKQAFLDQDTMFPEQNVYRKCGVDVESAYTEMLNILQERRDFSAVFAYNDMTAFGAMKAAYECRLRIPSDIAIVGVDNLKFADLCFVPLTTVDHGLGMVGALAMKRVLNIIHGKDDAPFPLMPEPSIVERLSA
jgi:LacI family transcriptional regulator